MSSVLFLLFSLRSSPVDATHSALDRSARRCCSARTTRRRTGRATRCTAGQNVSHAHQILFQHFSHWQSLPKREATSSVATWRSCRGTSEVETRCGWEVETASGRWRCILRLRSKTLRYEDNNIHVLKYNIAVNSPLLTPLLALAAKLKPPALAFELLLVDPPKLKPPLLVAGAVGAGVCDVKRLLPVEPEPNTGVAAGLLLRVTLNAVAGPFDAGAADDEPNIDPDALLPNAVEPKTV